MLNNFSKAKRGEREAALLRRAPVHEETITSGAASSEVQGHGTRKENEAALGVGKIPSDDASDRNDHGEGTIPVDYASGGIVDEVLLLEGSEPDYDTNVDAIVTEVTAHIKKKRKTNQIDESIVRDTVMVSNKH